MNHRPFEDWLLAEDPLSPQQKRELDAHLQTCPSCTALAEVNLALRSVRQADPPPGFAARFQVRLAAQRKAMRQRNAVGFIILAVSVAGLLTALTWPLLRAAVESPVSLLGSWLTALTNLWAALQALFHAAAVLLRVVPGLAPGYLWLILLFAFTGWSAAWVVSLKKVTHVLQGV